MEKIITYLGQTAKVGCDENCSKAWGLNNRPKKQLSDDDDDYVFLSDEELGVAPEDPGTMEGNDSKPVNKQGIPNKWCVRECERCVMSNPGEYNLPLELPDFSNPKTNIRS